MRMTDQILKKLNIVQRRVKKWALSKIATQFNTYKTTYLLRKKKAPDFELLAPGTLACPLLSVPLSCFFMQSLSVSSSGLAVLPNGSNVSVSDLNLCSQLHAQATSERSNRVSARRRHRPLLPRRRSAPRSSPVAAIAVIA
jgi:hypothetical protein